MEQNDDMLYNVLLQADLDDISNLCYMNNKSEQICHNQHFLNNKFDLLPFNIYKPIAYNFNNLLYINWLVKLSIKLIYFMKHVDGIRIDWLNLRGEDKDYIIEIKKFSPSLYDKLIAISNDLTYPHIDWINVPLNTKPVLNDPWYGHIEFFYLMYKDGQFWTYIGSHWPHAIDLKVPIQEYELIEYLVNVFLNYEEFHISRDEYMNIYGFDKKIKLQIFLDKNVHDIHWEEA